MKNRHKEILASSLRYYLNIISISAILIFIIFFTLSIYLYEGANLYILVIYIALSLLCAIVYIVSKNSSDFKTLKISSYACVVSALIGITLIYAILNVHDRLISGIFIALIASVLLTPDHKFILVVSASVLIFPNLALLLQDISFQSKLAINVYLMVGALLYATVSTSRINRIMQVAKLEMALAKQQEETERLARVDTLTGLWNRRHFFELAKRELSRSSRTGTLPGLILILDIDCFKSINDDFGHACGDQLLKHFAHVWTATLRESDILGRIGGEEFAVMLPETGIREGEQVAERIRQATEAEVVYSKDFSYGATISIGGAVIQRDETIDHALNRADSLLYKAKGAGRNCVKLEGAPSGSQG